MMTYDARRAADKASKGFPRWADIRKRLNTSTGGIYLQSLLPDQDTLNKAYSEFEKSFFLETYFGHESEVLCQICIAQVGSVDGVTIKDNKWTVTTDPHAFVNDTKKYALYQDGYLLLDPATVTEDKITYVHAGELYNATVTKKDLWNIFDEFAMFSNLKRYDGETNLELENRILLSFRNRANGTEQGLKNAITNSLVNKAQLKPEEIILEQPNETNMYLKTDGDQTVYDKLSALNKDLARCKVWNHTYWENGFKKSTYIPNEWDAEVPGYQAGVGQRDDLKVVLSSEADADSSDVEITGYKKNREMVNEYVRKQNIQKTIPLKLVKYKDELVSNTIEYKINATQPILIDPDDTYIQSMQHKTGSIDCLIDDIIEEKGDNSKVVRGRLEDNALYTLEFYPRSDYDDMSIANCTLKHDGVEDDLLHDDGDFKHCNGVFKNSKIKLWAKNISDVTSVNNIINYPSGGMTIGNGGTVGSFAVNLADMAHEKVTYQIECDKTNYTDNHGFVKLNGFSLIGDNELTATDPNKTSTVTVDMDCSSLSFDFAAAAKADEQGSITVQLTVDGNVVAAESGLKTDPANFSYNFGNLRHVQLLITKVGMYPVTIRNICAARYRVTMSVNGTTLEKDTQGNTYLPAFLDKLDMLKFKLESFSTCPPIIKSFTIGEPVTGSVYRLSNVKTGKNCWFSISTTCRVVLIKNSNDGHTEVLDSDYSTKSIYENETDEPQIAYIDTSSFISIHSSSKEIFTGAHNGVVMSYIILQPGERIENITIDGELKKITGSYPLAYFLNTTAADKVYVAKNATGFIVKRASTNDIDIVRIKRSSLLYNSDEFQFFNLTPNTVGAFMVDEQSNAKTISNTYAHDFEYCYITASNTQEYIAYNKLKMFQSPVSGIQMSNTFSPYVDMNELMFYTISDIAIDGSAVKANAKFINAKSTGVEYVNWSLGVRKEGIRAEYSADFMNSNLYQLEVNNLTESFSISNNIKLDARYLHGSTSYELARYMITVPDDMRITYSTDIVSEDVIIEEDGFNKLYYSNIKNITSVVLPNKTKLDSKKYSLIEDGGIIVWNDMSLVGESVYVTYEYRRPETLEFKELSSLYSIVGYSTDAYELINDKPMILAGMKDGETRVVEIDGAIPDKIVAHCDNINFTSIIDKNNVTVHKISSSALMLHSGYYYNDKDEYYMFANDHKEDIRLVSEIDMKNVDRTTGAIRTITSSSNYLLDTAMTNGNHDEVVCAIDCVSDQDRISGVSYLQSLTSCDSYQLWDSFNMDVSIVSGLNGMGLEFKTTGDAGYAILDITDFIKSDCFVSFSAAAGISGFITKEIVSSGERMMKSVFADKVAECSRSDNFLYYHFGSVDGDLHYYLVVTGSGMIDDIIIQNGVDEKTFAGSHKKNIDDMGFSIAEVASKSYLSSLMFGAVGSHLNGLDINQNGVIETGSSVDWGITLAHSFDGEFSDFVTVNIDTTKDAFYAHGSDGSIISPWIPIRNHQSVDMLFFKINNVLLGELKYFNIQAYTAEDADGTGRRLVGTQKKANLLSFTPTSLSEYVQIVVEMPAGRVINNIEIYAKYIENEYPLHISQNGSGSMITKVYDTAAVGNYKPIRMVGSVTRPEYVTLQIRGYRQDEAHGVWTEWYPCPFDESMSFSADTHIFDGYRYFQFKIGISDMNANIKIDEIILEVV